MKGIVVTLLLLPLLAGFMQSHLERGGLRRGLTLAASAGALLLSLFLFAGTETAPRVLFCVPLCGSSAELVLAPDRMGAFFAIVFAFVWLFTAAFGFGYLERHYPKVSRTFFLFYMLVLSALFGLCVSGNLITYYLFFEGMALLSIPFITLRGGEEARAAAKKYLGYSVLGAGLVLFGLLCLVPYGGTELFADGGILRDYEGNGATLLPLFFLMVLGFGCKAGLAPLQDWLPTAHPVALTPGSAVLSGVITKAGVLGVVRLCGFVFPEELILGSWAQKLCILLVLITIFSGSMLALREQDLKRCLAYSTVSQVSYALLGVLLLDQTALCGALLQVVFHAVSKAVLFLCAGMLLSEENIHRRDEMAGLLRRRPLLLGCMAVASLSMVGVPPFGGFFAKWQLCLGALQAGVFGPACVGMLIFSAALTAGYLFPPVIDGIYKPQPGKEATQ